MIEKLLIEDFQRHSQLLVEFDPHVNVIMGATDAGKSASIRALLWLATNQPRGDSFIKHGQKRTSVTLWVDGHEIKRVRGNGVNTYQLDGGSPYEAFGTGVPDEIANILNIYPASIQRQLDSVFLFSQSPGEVSRELNSVVNLELIDSVLSHMVGEQKKARLQVEVCEERLDHAKKRKEELAWVKDADRALKEVEELESQVDKERDSLNDLTSAIGTLDDLDRRLHQDDHAIIALAALVELGEQIMGLRGEVEEVQDLVDQIDRTAGQVDKVGTEIKTMEEAIKAGLGGRCPVCGAESGDML